MNTKDNLISISPKQKIIKFLDSFRLPLIAIMVGLAGGRGLLGDKGEKCFRSGANAAISGDMLTTAGITVETDMKLTKRLGYEVRLGNE